MAKKITIVGGGLGGLTAAATAARAGAEVLLLEARSELGGRARTEDHNGFLLNEGAHALYAAGPGIRVLNKLGITPQGHKPPLRGYGQLREKVATMPGTPADLVRSSLIGLKAKSQLAKLLANPRKLLTTELANRSMLQWVEEQVSHRDAQAVVLVAARTATYQDDLGSIAAEVAVPHLISALTDGVLYLDGGWRQLVDRLRDVATLAGAKIDSDSKIESLADIDGCDAIILATGGPGQASKILGGRSAIARTWADRAEPVYAAGLDLGMARLPLPGRRFCLSLDSPLYFSTHTPSAALAPSGGDVVHVLRYGVSKTDPRAEMENYLDAVQPGWRDQVRAERFGKQWVVAHDRPTPSRGPLTNRPGPTVPDCDGVYVAGDWVGAHGLLADASISSGEEAALLAVAHP
jgi:phytoene dehydrogenase-like protein